MSTYENSKNYGQSPHQRTIINVNNDDWYAFNKEYYKLREMEYYIGYKVPEVVALRGKVRALVETEDFEIIEQHWHVITEQDEHQVVVHH
jgi:hypothetical protein